MRRILTLTILSLALLSAITTLDAQSREAAQKSKIKRLEQAIAKEEQQLAQMKSDRKSANRRVELLIQQIDNRNRLIRETNREIKALEAEVKRSESRIAELSGNLTTLEKSASEMVRAAYRAYRQQNTLAYIFSAKSFAEMARRMAMLRTATNHRNEQMEQIVAARKDVQREKEQLEARRNELRSSRARLDRQRTKLNKDAASARRTIKQLTKREREAMQTISRHKKSLDAAVRELRKLTKGNKEGDRFTANTRNLHLPVVGGRIRCKGNMAEIAGKEGDNVRTIYDGKVVDVKTNKQSGKYEVYVAHGGYITSYANLSSVTVAKNDVVKRNQTIGVIGSAINMSTMNIEYKIVFGIFAPSPDIIMSAENCFRK